MAVKSGDYFFASMLPFAVLGVGLNRYVDTVNGLKTPVKMYNEIAPFVIKSPLHQPMTDASRHAWLGDWIPLRIGRKFRIISIGDISCFLDMVSDCSMISILIVANRKREFLI